MTRFANIALSSLVIIASTLGLANADDAAKKSNELITEDLFDDLSAAKPVEKPIATQPSESKPAASATEASAGEDLDFGSAQDPFAEVARKMQRSQELLGKRELTATSNALRGEIVSDLDKLLNKMQKQCSGGQCNKPSSDCKDGNCNKPGAASKPGKSAAKDSTKRLEKSESTESQAADEADIIREVWGHLPPKLREAMQNASFEEYLPKYDQHIRDYYRRLAEESRAGTK